MPGSVPYDVLDYRAEIPDPDRTPDLGLFQTIESLEDKVQALLEAKDILEENVAKLTELYSRNEERFEFLEAEVRRYTVDEESDRLREHLNDWDCVRFDDFMLMLRVYNSVEITSHEISDIYERWRIDEPHRFLEDIARLIRDKHAALEEKDGSKRS